MNSNHKTLIVPYTSVAEIIPFENPTPLKDAPEWLVGKIDWRGVSIPIVSFDKKDFSDTKQLNRMNLHIAIFNRLADISNLDFIGLVIEGIPQMSRFKAKDFELVKHTPGNFLSMEVLIHKAPAFIPNIEWIEKSTAERSPS
jgi:chemosensory pili system protein ChpC